MNMNKTVKLIVATLFVGALSGCGDKVDVKVDNIVQVGIESHGYTFTKGEVYQISEATLTDFKSIENEAEMAMKLFNYSLPYEEILKADASFIKNADLAKLVEQNRELVKTASVNDVSAWEQHVEAVKADFAPALADSKQKFAIAQDKQDKFTSFYAKEALAKENLLAQIDRVKGEQAKLYERYTAAIKKDIVDLKLPIRIRDSYDLSYRTSWNKKSTTCKPYKTISGFYLEERCYYLNPEHADLASAPSFTVGQTVLQEQVKLELEKKGYSQQIDKLNKHIRDAQIIAENQLGVRKYNVEREYNNAKRNYERYQKAYESKLTDDAKSNFLANEKNKQSSKIRESFYAFMNTQAMKVIQTSKHEESKEFEAQLPVDKGAARSVLVYQYQGKRGTMSLMVPFVAKESVDSKQPVTISPASKVYEVRSAVTPSTERLQTLLLKS